MRGSLGHCRMFSCICGLYPVDASSTPSTPSSDKNVSRHCCISPGGATLLLVRGPWIYQPYSCRVRAVISTLQPVPEIQILHLEQNQKYFTWHCQLMTPLLLSWTHWGLWPWPLRLLMTSWWPSNPLCVEEYSRKGCKLSQVSSCHWDFFSYRNTDINGGFVSSPRKNGCI